MVSDHYHGLIYHGGWLDKYRHLLGDRFVTFKIAFNVLVQRGGGHIVETGSLRSVKLGSWQGDGNSTILFGEFVMRHPGHLWTVDIDEEAIAFTRRITRLYGDRITYIQGDSITFLERFDHEIDLLYLDSRDCSREGDAGAAQEHNFKELRAAYPAPSSDALVLIDDNWYENGGKAALSKRYLQARSWICLFDSQQTLWMRA